MFRLQPVLVSLALVSTAVTVAAQEAPPLAFLEQFALAEDRDAVAGQLLAGSPMWYELQVLRAHQRGQLDEARRLLGEWTKRLGPSEALVRAENRDALLGVTRDPRATFAFLRQRLGLTFDATRASGAGDPSLPTRLDPKLLTISAWSARAFEANPGSLRGFADSALDWLVEEGSTLAAFPELSRELLARVPSPDLPSLPALIVRDLETRHTSFGALKVHGDLRLEALEECARLRPALLEDGGFVAAWLARLAPSEDVDVARDAEERGRWLARLRSFTDRLPPSQNSLKANVLHHTLRHQLARGEVVRADLLAYLALPQARRFANPKLVLPKDVVDTGRAFSDELGEIGDDEALVRAALAPILARDEDVSAFAPFLDAAWLRTLLAETRLLGGDPDAARWAAMLTPEGLRALEQRVELTFPPTRREWFGADEPVALEVVTKNVPDLLVRVFAIDAFRALVERGVELDTALALDGLVASEELRQTYGEPPLRRVTRRFELPELTRPGTYLVEFVGGGQVSRALVRKGHLTAIERVVAAGHVFQAFDERGELVKDAHLWFGGRDWQPDERGEILLPFTTDSGEKTAVVHQGARASLVRFEHEQERFRLELRSHVPREGLIAGAEAPLVLQPRLALAGARVSLKLLEEPVLRLELVDLDGRVTSQDVRGLVLGDEQEFVQRVRVPERLRALTVRLRGRVTALDGKRVELESAPETLEVNAIDDGAEIAQPLLLRTPRGYVVELVGKDGERLADRPLKLLVQHRDFQNPLATTLKTDQDGRCELGALPGVRALDLGGRGQWSMLDDGYVAQPRRVDLVAGETLRLAYLGRATRATRASFGLLGQSHDEFSKLALKDGFLEVSGLAPGDYRLHLRETGETVDVRVTAGARRGAWLVGGTRILEATANRALGLRAPVIEGDALVVRVDGASAATRVLVEAERYVHGEGGWARPEQDPGFEYVQAPASLYEVGRALSPELRYVLERRAAPRFPGNLLPRPSLLLNPLDLALAVNALDAFGSGGGAAGRFGGRGGGKKKLSAARDSAFDSAAFQLGASFNLDFLPRPATLLANLRPDANGIVRVPLAELGPGPLVTVTVLEGDECLRRVHLLEERPFTPRARHLAPALPAGEHVAEQRILEFVPGGTPLVLDATRTARSAVLGTLADVFRVWLAADDGGDLAQFEFLTRWPSLPRAEQLALYDRFACHELSFFLHEKDPAFFAEVVRPYLANKLEKTFLDHWLLEDDLTSYLEPWAFDDLNWIERILLAQRVAPGAAEPIRRALAEAGELLPPQREHERQLFELALDSAALTAGASEKDKAGRYKGPGDSPAPTSPGAPGAPPATEESNEEQALAGLGYGGETETDSDGWFLGAGKKDAERLARELEQRKSVATLYRAPEPSRRFVEHQYWHRVRTAGDGFPALVRPSAFWRDYATAPLERPFVSRHVLTADGSLLERLFALAVLDLPFVAGADETRSEGGRELVTRPSARLSVRLERAPVEPASGPTNLLLGENYLRLDERTVVEDGETRDRYVSGELLVGVPYLAQVLVTNTASWPRVVELVLQIPAGALPLSKGFWTRGTTLELAPFSTGRVEYAFYFPAAGAFAHYPAQAAEKGKLLAAGAARTLTVVSEPTQLDTTSWERVSQEASSSEVLAFVQRANLGRLDLGRIAWRLKERAFYAALVAELRARHHQDELVWSWSLFHEDPATAREYLERSAPFLAQCDATLETPLLALDPLRRYAYRQLEIEPLILARVYRRPDELDDGSDLARQYRALLTNLALRRELGNEDWLAVSYYQLLAGRVPEALASFGKVDPQQLAARLQYDYLAAYLGFHSGDLAPARTLVARYEEHPLAHWRERITAVRGALAELDGGRPVQAGVEPERAADPVLELVSEGRNLRVRYRDLARCELGFAPLDVELAFSVQPFREGAADAAGYVQARETLALELPADKNELVVPVPAALAQADLRVEARAAGLSRRCTLLASALDVRYLEQRGELSVADAAGKPLSAVYVKCFARQPDGSVRFHKDGYTDLRGRFDYVSLSDDPDLAATRFAVLVQSDTLGADIREVAPPAR